MITLKKILLSFTLTTTFGLISPILQANLDDDINVDDLTSISLDDLDQFEQENIVSRGGGGGPPAPTLRDVATFLAITPKETKPLWLNTKPPKGRDVLYLLPHKITTLEYGGLALSLFFNMTNKMHVGAASLLDFDNIDKTNTIAALAGAFPAAAPGGTFTEEHLTQLFQHFRQLNIQDRKIGSFIQGGFVKGAFSLQIQTSLHLAAKNFWLDNRSQEEVRNILRQLDPKLAEGNLNKKEFYILNYGMGDTRIKTGINSLNMAHLQVDTGFEFILPTSRFVSNPISNITISQQSLPNDAKAIIETVFPNILRHNIRDILLQPELGNGGHFGFGWYIESKINLPNNLAQLWGRFSFDNLIAREQKRLIMYKQTIQDLGALPIPGSDAEALQRISKLLREFYFPSVFEVESHPGGIFNFVLSINKEIKKWHCSLGYDYLTQQKEYIKKIYNSGISLLELDIEGAESQSLSQHKIFGEVMRTKRFKKFDLDIGLGGDVTAKSRNLGYDWTVYLKLASSF